MTELQQLSTSVLDIAYTDSGPRDAMPVVLLHGFPYDPSCYDEVVPLLHAADLRTIVPYLRGYGPTRFRSADTLRSGEQAALGRDLHEMLDALRIDKAVLAGFDWGGRAACVVAGCGRSGWRGWSVAAATICRTSPMPTSRPIRRWKRGCGTSTTSISSAAAAA